MQTILRKIFRSRRGNAQFIFAGLGFLIGLLLMLVSLQLYIQVQSFLKSKSKYAEYIILSKKINMGNTLLLSRATFKESEIRDLEKQPFIDQVGRFTSNQYQVVAKSTGTIPLFTELFFEAVPDNLVDVKPNNWQWDEDSEFLPVILSQDMLNLYNFGYALGKGLPQLSPDMMGMVSINVHVIGPQGRRTFKAKVAGFSERIPSILVPESFMDWANKNIGTNEEVPPSRLIIKVNNPSDPALAKYLKKKKFQINEDRLNASKAGSVIQLAMSIIGLIGLFFIILAFVVFSMNFRVMLAEARQEIRLLIQLGYTSRHITRFLMLHFSTFILILLFLTSILLYLAVSTIQQFLLDNGLNIAKGIHPLVWLIALIFTGLTLLMNLFSVFRSIKKYA